MDEQNNQKFEKNSLISNIKEKITSFIKHTPKKTLIIGASIIGAVIISTIILIIVFAGGNKNNSNSCNHYYSISVYSEPGCTYSGSEELTCIYCGYSYITYGNISPLGHDWKQPTSCTDVERCSRCYAKKDPNSEPAGHTWIEATCTTKKECTLCGETEGFALGHDYSNTTDGTCTRCDDGVKFILPTTPITIMSTVIYDQTCKIESIKIERVTKYSTTRYVLTFIVQSTYHEKGNNYSDEACFGWKLYDEDGLVVTSGTGYTDGDIKVGEKSKETITFYVGDDEKVQDGETYRFELLNIS